jgi:hypothetical protein
MTTVLYEDRVSAIPDASAQGGHLWLSPADLARATGWKLESEGLCKGAACVRTDQRWLDAQGRVDLLAFAGHMGQPVVEEKAHDVLAFGTSVGARRETMDSLQAPDFTLPDLDGKLHSLSDYRGKKVYLFSWGSY